MQQRTRVLWLITGLGPGGAEQLLVSAAGVRDRAAFDYEAAYLLPWEDRLVPALEGEGVRVRCLGGGHPLDLAWAGRLRALLLGTPYDILHLHSPYVAGVAHLAVSEQVRASVPARLRQRVEIVVHGLVLDAGVPVRFAAVGQGPLEAEIAAEHRRLGLGDGFQLLGYRPDAVRITAACDLFALASRYEGLSVAIMEALAAGVPVVATAVGGVPGAVTDGVEGVLVPPARPELLADAILGLARDHAQRERVARAAAARGRAFDIVCAVRHIEAGYQALAA